MLRDPFPHEIDQDMPKVARRAIVPPFISPTAADHRWPILERGRACLAKQAGEAIGDDAPWRRDCA